MDLTTAHSLWLAPLCLALGLGLAWLLYRRSAGKEGFSRNLSIALAAIRALAVAIIAFFLLEPMVRILIREVRKPVVVILHDGSSSLLSSGDTAAIRGTLAASLDQLSRELSDRYTVSTMTYGQEVRNGLHFEQEDALTDIGQALRETYDRFSGPDLGAVILTGDGISNRGRDPRLEAVRIGVPVHTIALGDTTVRPDLTLKAVEHNRINFLGNEFPVLVRVEARFLKDARTKVTLSQDGKELAGRDLVISSEPFFQEIPFTLKAERPGLQRFTASVRSVAGEVSLANNAMDIHIEVLDDRQKVLLLGAAPHPDLGALRLALDGLEGYGTELAMASEFTGQVEDFDLIILHQLPSPKHGISSLVQRAAERNIPICVILGQGMDFNAFNALGGGVRVTGMRNIAADAQAAVNKDFTAFTLEADQGKALERFPPLQMPLGQYELGRSASAMLYQRVGAVRTAYPLIAVLQQGERRMATISGEGLWRWRISDMQQNGSHSQFDRVVHKLVQYLALKVNKNRFRVQHEAEIAENDAVVFTAELYNASYERVNVPEVTIAMEDEDGREFPYAFSRVGDSYRLDAGRLPAGNYSWLARTELDGERFSVKGEVVVRKVMTEQITTVADHALLADLAARTGGLSVTPDRIGELADAIAGNEDLVARSYVHSSFSDLIGLRWIFFVLLALLTSEWVLRRRNGAY